MEKVKSHLLYLVLVLLSVAYGCGTLPSDFYGMKVTQKYLSNLKGEEWEEPPFEIDRYYLNTTDGMYTVDFTYVEGATDRSVYAYASCHRLLSITVINNSNRPISTNYFGDQFSIITRDGKIIHMKNGDISFYPSEEYINPGAIVKYSTIVWPFNPPVNKSDVTAIVCSLGVINKTTIVLRPLPSSNKVKIKAKESNVEMISQIQKDQETTNKENVASIKSKTKFEEEGTLTDANGNKYVGEWTAGRKNGQVTMTLPDGAKYVGELKDGKFNGQGTMTYANGAKYVGEWKDGMQHGQGTYTWTNGNKYEGNWENDKSVGGWYYWANGRKTWSYIDLGGNWVHKN